MRWVEGNWGKIEEKKHKKKQRGRSSTTTEGRTETTMAMEEGNGVEGESEGTMSEEGTKSTR